MLNEAQQLAITTRVANVLVSAGAGSGKTRVLTSRYLALLDNGKGRDRYQLDDILMLTFTRKAAQEMRERIAGELAKQGRMHERREISRAPIGTIHSFCESILREYALDAGIDPNFRLLDDAETHTLLENALDAVFEDLWAGTQQEREEIGKLVLEIPQQTLRSALLAVYETSRTHGRSLQQQVLIPNSDISAIASSLCRAIDDLLSQQGGTAKWKSNLEQVEAAYQELRPYLQTTPNFSWEIYYLVEAMKPRLTPRGGLTSANQTKKEIKEALEQWLGAYLDFEAQAYLTAFTTLLSRLDDMYRGLKEAQGLLDFSDLLLLTRDLLNNDDSIAAKRLRKQYRQIMVDEFQDTNPLQFGIIQSLQGDDHLFMVGDVKQAIYRFIGSDIQVFLDQERRIHQLGDDGLRIPMHINYRTRPEILQPLNGLFKRLWQPETCDDGFTFEPLTAGQQFIKKCEPSVELALWPQGKTQNAAELRDREASWIANRILQLTGQFDEEPLEVTDKPIDGQDEIPGRPAQFGDIILLFQVSSNIPLYEDALRRAGVPFYVVSGRGFYSTREIQDILYFLRVLENPMDDFSIAVVLRSPLVGIRDDAIYWITRNWENWEEGKPHPTTSSSSNTYGKIWSNIQRLEKIPTLCDGDREKLLAFKDLVTDLQCEMPAGQPLDLIDTILTRTNYANVLLAADNGAQRFANIQKLREVALTFQNRGIFDLTDFQRYLTQLSEQATREASAPLDVEGGNVVRLMTVHASKGLEAPVVFLADCGWKSMGVSDHFLFTKDGLSCLVPTPEDDTVRPLSYQRAAERIVQEERREAERLLYVALTRAREHLICSGFTSFPAEGKRIRYMDILAGLLGLTGAIAEDTDIPMPFADTAYPIRVWCPATLDHVISLQPPEQSPTLWDEYHTEILNGAELPILTDAATVDSFQRLTDRLQELPKTKRQGPLRIGVHRALCYRACPRQYWYKYILQDDGALLSMQIASPDTESEDPSVINEDDETERMDGTAFGKMLHAVMERLQFSQPLSEQLPDIFLELQREQSIIPSAVEQQHIERCLTNFMAMPIYQKLQQATETFRELRFLAREDHVYIPGIIDVLAKIDDQWWILDYKTGKSFSADHVRQLALYALGVQHALGVMPSMICLAYVDATNSRNYRVETVTEELLDEARQIIKRASEGIGKDDFHPISGHQCTFCPCKEICPESMPTVLPGEASQLRFDI